MKKHLEYVVHDAHHPQRNRIVVPLSGFIEHHDRQYQQDCGDNIAQMSNQETVGDQKQCEHYGTHFFFKGIGAKTLFRHIQLLLLPDEDPLQQQTDRAEEHTTNGDTGEGLIGVFSSVWTCTGIRNHSTALRTTKIAPDIISLLYLIFIIQYLFLKWVPHISAIWGTAECHCTRGIYSVIASV